MFFLPKDKRSRTLTSNLGTPSDKGLEKLVRGEGGSEEKENLEGGGRLPPAFSSREEQEDEVFMPGEPRTNLKKAGEEARRVVRAGEDL